MAGNKRKHPKFYAVASGRSVGVFQTWSECQEQVRGFPGATFKSFSTREEAETFVDQAKKPLGDTSKSNEKNSKEDEVSESKKPKKSGKQKFYGVISGHKTGVFDSWAECQKQVQGYSKAIFRSFSNREEAESFVEHETMKKDTEHGDEGVDCEKHEKFKEETVNEQTSAVSPALRITIHFDGGARGNPNGVAGAGARVVSQKMSSLAIITDIREYVGPSGFSNNFAEYTGMKIGLEEVRSIVASYIAEHDESGGPIQVHIRGDSNLIISQMNGVQVCRSSNLMPLHQACKKLLEEIRTIVQQHKGTKNGNNVITFQFEHVYRSDNAVADALANEAMDQRRSWRTTTPLKPVSATTKSGSSDLEKKGWV